MNSVTHPNKTVLTEQLDFPYAPYCNFGSVSSTLVTTPRKEWTKIVWKVDEDESPSNDVLYIVANIYNSNDEIEAHVEYTIDTVQGRIDNFRFYPVRSLVTKENAFEPLLLERRQQLREDAWYYILRLKGFWLKTNESQEKKSK